VGGAQPKQTEICFSDIKKKLKVDGANGCEGGRGCRREHLKIGAKLSPAERRLIEDAFDRMVQGPGTEACTEALRRYPSR